MIHFGKCIKYQYRDTTVNQVSVSQYNLEVSYPTLQFTNVTDGRTGGQTDDMRSQYRAALKCIAR